jgi:cell division protein FtsW (lipid II flippase)
MALAWSVVVMAVGALAAVALPLIVAGDNGEYCESIDHPGTCSSPVPFVLPGLVVVAIGVWGLVASVAYCRRRAWARPAMIVTFSVWGLLALVSVVGAASQPGLGTRGVIWLALLAYFTTIVVLAARGDARTPSPPVWDAGPVDRAPSDRLP